MRNFTCSAIVIALVGLTRFGADANASDFGRTEGGSGVSPSGAATYSIPIWTPPGPNGVTPAISINYSSQAGNGLAGVGWNVSATSSIERCNRTPQQDGNAAAVSLSANDGYCIGGNRLRLFSGTYGTGGSVYYTELADYSRITAYGSLTNGPEHYVVEAKNGLRYEYGNTNDSRVALGGAVLRWMLNRVSDRNGNNYVITYTNAGAVGFAVPNQILWTPTSLGASTYRYEAKFNYLTTRSDSDSYIGKVAGYDVSNRNRLEYIQIKSAGVVVRRYHLAYDTSSVTSRSRLTSAKECADDTESNCFLPITFTYQTGMAGVTAGAGTPPTGSSNGLLPGRYDLNGDGKDDLLYLSGGSCYAAFGANTGFSGPYNVGTTTCGTVDRFLPNGRDAVAVTLSGIRWVYRWDDATSAFIGYNTGVAGGETYSADYDGDGLADFISWTNSNLIVRRNTSTGSGNPSFSSTTFTTASLSGIPGARYVGVWTYFGKGLQRADVNGDGRQDIYAQIVVQIGMGATGYSAVLLGSSSGYTVPSQSTWGGPTVDAPSINFNGDACTDRQFGNTILIAQCNGIAATSVSTPAAPLQMLDWDGDGKTDILVNSGGLFSVYLSTGAGFSGPIATSISSTGTFYAVDQDGDHQEDLIKLNGSSAISYWTHTPNGQVPTPFASNIPDLLSNATDGYGVSFSPGYVSTAWGTNYDKGATTSYPLQESDPAIVTAQATASNGIGGTFNKTYYYQGARDNAARGEPVGFQRFDETDSRNGLIRRTYFEQSFPVARMVSQQELMQPNGTTTISRIVFSNTFATLDSSTNNQRYFAYPSGSTTTEYEVGGTYNTNLLRTVVVASLYDNSSGTLYDQTVTTTEPASGAHGVTAGGSWIARTYLPVANLFNDTTNWCLGRPGLVQEIRSSNLTYGAQITRTTNLSWNGPSCRPTQTVAESGNSTLQVTTDLGYDGFGNLNSTTVTGIGMNARLTTATYSDGTNTTGQFPLTVSEKVSATFTQTSSMTWNYDFAVLASATDPNGITTSWQYDAFGRRSRADYPNGIFTRWTYGDCAAYGSSCQTYGKMFYFWSTRETATNAAIGGDSFTLDAFDRPIWELPVRFGIPTNVSASIQTTYDALGRVASESIPKMSASVATPFWNTYQYDLVDRLTSASRPISETNSTLQTTNFYYEGLTTRVVDPQSKQQTRVANSLGQLARSIDHDNYYQQFDYDSFGNVKQVQDYPGNLLQSSNYNLRGMLTSRFDMDMGTRNFTPDALGQTVSQTDAKNQSTSFTFDLIGRMTSRAEAEGTSNWTWGSTIASHNIGRLESVSGPGYSESYLYDSLARLQTRTISADTTYQFDYSYNGKGQLQTITFPTTTNSCRFKIQFTYWFPYLQSIANASDPAQCGSTGETYWTANEGNAFDELTKETLGNSLIVNHSYDLVTGLLKSIQSGPNGGSAVQNLSYEWDMVGNLTKRKDINQSNLTETFFYDNLYRLDYSQLNGVENQSVNYDPLGNIINKTDVGAYTYDTTKKHQVLSTGAPTSWSFTYDANGNMTTGRGRSIDWTSYNYPACIKAGTACSGTTTDYAQFSYTPDRQYWKQVAYYTGGSGGLATTIYVGGMLEKVTTTAGTDYRHMIRAGNSTIIVSRQSGGTNSVYYATQDHLGSNSAITNSAGAVLVNESFDAYGKRRGSNWTGSPSSGDWTAIATITRRGFTDHSMLDNLGLIHMNGRVQDPWLGRIVSADPNISDPLDTQSFNRYSYVQNRPLSYVDPSGFSPRSSGREFGEDPWFVITVDGWFTGWGAFYQELRESYLEHPDPTDQVNAAGPGSAPVPPPPPINPNPTGQSTRLPADIGQWSACYKGQPSIHPQDPNAGCESTSWSCFWASMDISAGNYDAFMGGVDAVSGTMATRTSSLIYGEPVVDRNSHAYRRSAAIVGIGYAYLTLGASALEQAAVRGGVAAVEGVNAASGAANTVTVGRWMSQAELKAMQNTGRVQESFNSGVTSVTLPPNPAAYGAAPAGDVFVQFDVPQSAIGAADGVWGKIFGPNSIFGPAKGITEMPPATNILVSP